MTNCLTCKKTSLIPAGIRVIGENHQQKLCYDWICLECGLYFREYVIPFQGRKIDETRLFFKAPHPTTKATANALRSHDKTLYEGWKDVLEDIDSTLRDHQDTGTYSQYACHFLTVSRFFVRQLLIILTKRLSTLEDSLKGSE